jgi:mRNA interferase HicA
MSVKRRELVKHLEENGFSLLREGKKHSIYTNGEKDDSDQKAPDI